MKIRNLLIIFIVNYLLIVFISTGLEIVSINNKAQEAQALIKQAADLALDQTQLVDDFLGYGGNEALSLSFPARDGSGFQRADMFEAFYGLNSAVDTNKEAIYQKLYGGNNDLKMLASRLNAMRKPVRYWDASRTFFDWYYIPTASLLGTDILPNTQSTTGVKDKWGSYIDSNRAYELLNAYQLTNHVRESGGVDYYNTPLNVGITFLNEELLSSMFITNVDLLMRNKYSENLNSPEGGDGILKGSTYSDKVRDGLAGQNPINNGSLTVLRGESVNNGSTVNAYKGVTPLVMYKVIDMYDSANDEMLAHLFGANKGGYTSKAAYLRSLDENVINPATGMPYTKKPIVVAKVTFYMDVIVPYFSVIARDFRSSLGDDEFNYVDIKPEGTTSVEGTRRLSYTRYFAVTP